MSTDSLKARKHALRNRYKTVRAAASPEEKAARDRAIREHILTSEPYRECGVLMTYLSTEEEIDTNGLIRRALADGKAIALPRVLNRESMAFYVVTSLDGLVRSRFGILEPPGDESARLTDFEGAVCLVPCIAADRRGNRLGYGGGYYDRYLSGLPDNVATIVLCCEDCLLPELESGPFDIAGKYLATERGFYSINYPPRRD